MSLSKNKYSEDELQSVGKGLAESIRSTYSKPPKSVYDFNYDYLNKLVSYCQEEGWRPVLITTPVTDYCTRYFSREFLAGFHDKVERIGKKEGVLYLDFSRDAEFSGKAYLFKDADHLNTIGRRRFTEVVIEKLKEMNML